MQPEEGIQIGWYGGYTLKRAHAVPEIIGGGPRALCGRRPPPFGWTIDGHAPKHIEQKRCKLCEAEMRKEVKP